MGNAALKWCIKPKSPNTEVNAGIANSRCTSSLKLLVCSDHGFKIYVRKQKTGDVDRNDEILTVEVNMNDDR